MKKLTLIVLLGCLSFGISQANNKVNNKIESNYHNSKTEKVIRVRQYVLVEMKDGTVVKAIVLGRQGNNKFWVRKVGAKRQGMVHKKHIIPLTENPQKK